MSGGGSSSSSTQVNQHYPTWAGPNRPTDYSDDTAYDASQGSSENIGNNWIPMYLSSALTMAASVSIPNSVPKAAFLAAYNSSSSGATANFSIQNNSVVLGPYTTTLSGSGYTVGQILSVGSVATPAFAIVTQLSGSGSVGTSCRITVNTVSYRSDQTPDGPISSVSVYTTGTNYLVGNILELLPPTGSGGAGGGGKVQVTGVDAFGGVTSITLVTPGGHYHAGNDYQTTGTPGVVVGLLSNIYVISGGTGYGANGSISMYLYPAISGTALSDFDNTGARQLDTAPADNITDNLNSSKYAKLTQHEIDAMSSMHTRAVNGDSLAVQGLGLLNSILNGDKLAGSTDFSTMLIALTTASQTDFTNRIYSRLTAKTFLNGNIDTTFLGQTLVTDGATSTKWGTRYNTILTDDNYRIERNHQNNSVPVSIQYGDLDYINAEALRMAGLWNRQYVQGRLKDNYEAILASDVLKYKSLEILGNAISGMIGAKISITRPLVRPNGWVSVGGGALSGFAAGGPWGAAAGAIMGAFSAQSQNAQF